MTTATARRTLDARRNTETFRFDHDGCRYFATVSYFEDGQVAELFLNAGKAGSALSTMARDAAVLVSLALQHRIPVATIMAALSRIDDKTMAGPIGVALALAGGHGS